MQSACRSRYDVHSVVAWLSCTPYVCRRCRGCAVCVCVCVCVPLTLQATLVLDPPASQPLRSFLQSSVWSTAAATTDALSSALSIAAGLADTVATLHANGVYHGQLSIDTVAVTPDEQPLMLMFATQPSQVDHSTSVHADVRSVGALFYEVRVLAAGVWGSVYLQPTHQLTNSPIVCVIRWSWASRSLRRLLAVLCLPHAPRVQARWVLVLVQAQALALALDYHCPMLPRCRLLPSIVQG